VREIVYKLCRRCKIVQKTLEQTVVEPIVNKILKIFERHETKEMKEEIDTIEFDDIKEISTF